VTQGLEGIISHLEKQKVAIEKALEALRGFGSVSSGAVADKGNRRSEAQKAQWAAVKAAGAPASKKPRRLTPEGRKRLSENMRKRWAAKRTAAQSTKRKRAA
jgi:hypothetical protein